MKFKFLIFLFSTLLIAVFLIFYIRQAFLSVSDDAKSQDFMINKGASVTQIGNKLESAGLIKNAIAFKFYVQLTSSQNKIQAGEFVLSPNLSLTQIVNELKKGPKEIWVTIPEGLRREEIALKFKEGLSKDEAFIKEFLTLTSEKEGYLYPDTYLFPKTVTATQVVNKLTKTFESKAGTEITSEQVIIASMLERETFADSEKSIVAGIIYKRLDNDWPLQIDATLQYAKDNLKFKAVNMNNKYWELIYSADKELNSPFNTYKNLGLPPAPIANAGLTSLEAAKNPEDSDYWYYIHDNDGQIHFAKDLSEHNANINKYLK